MKHSICTFHKTPKYASRQLNCVHSWLSFSEACSCNSATLNATDLPMAHATQVYKSMKVDMEVDRDGMSAITSGTRNCLYGAVVMNDF